MCNFMSNKKSQTVWSQLNDKLSKYNYKQVKQICSNYGIAITKSDWDNHGGFVINALQKQGLKPELL